MLKCANKHEDIQPAAFSDFSNVRIYQVRKQEVFEKDHILGIGKKCRAIAKKDQVDFPGV